MIMDIHKFNEALQCFAVARNIDEIRDLCDSFVRQLGFDTFVYALRFPAQFSESRLIIITSYPDAWIDHYFENDYSSADPVMDHCKKHVTPFAWHDIAKGSSNTAEKVMSEAAEFGLRNGVTVPVHAPHGELGIFSMALNRNNKSALEVTDHALPFVQLLASYLHESLRRVSDFGGAGDEKNILSDRERECLRWVADGKTSWEISVLLNVSERTVNFHLKNAAVKLDVFNRQHAVVKAVLKGLIHPRPF